MGNNNLKRRLIIMWEIREISDRFLLRDRMTTVWFVIGSILLVRRNGEGIRVRSSL